ncbi:anti-sigma factor RsbA family regulatory protein [Actinokineospora sp. NPDC004072]
MTARGPAHHALVYTDTAELVAESVSYLRAGAAEGRAAFAIVPPATGEPLRAALGADLSAVRIIDMAAVGANPARIVPALREVVDAAEGGRARGVAQAWWPERGAAASAEVMLHEALVDIAFADAPGLQLLCPYPADGPGWVESCHRAVVEDGVLRPSRAYDPDLAATTFSAQLDDNPDTVADVAHFSLDDLPELRDLVTIRASAAGLDRDRALDLTLAANEIVTNSICHGGERGTLRLWTEPGEVVCEVSDSGHLDSALIGRVAPLPSVRGGRGVWLANQLCDLVRIRSCPKRGTVVRLHMLI